MNQPQPMAQQVAPVPPKQPLITPWLLIVFIIVLLTGGGYLGWNYYSQSKTTTETPVAVVTTPTTTATTKTYTNTDYGFTFDYPVTWKAAASTKVKDENWLTDIKVNDENFQPDSQDRPNMDIAIYAKLTPDLNDSGDNQSLTTLQDYLDKAKYADGTLMYKDVAPATIAGKSGYTAIITNDIVSGKFYFVELSDGKILYIIDYDKSIQTAAILASLKFTTASTTPITSP